MNYGLDIFMGSAVTVGFVHTALGIDHTVPFLVLGRAQDWPLRKILGVTFLCGLAHVGSSVLLGSLGARIGMSLQKWEVIQHVRGNMAAWSLIIFGFTYAAWSFAKSRRMQAHLHSHEGGEFHAHDPNEPHVGLNPTEKARLVTTWTLFIIFVLGPCEPLVPLIMVPALKVGFWAATKVAIVFALTTISTMLVLVSIGYYGVSFIPLRRLQVHANTLAGVAVAVSGIAIQLFGI